MREITEGSRIRTAAGETGTAVEYDEIHGGWWIDFDSGDHGLATVVFAL